MHHGLPPLQEIATSDLNLDATLGCGQVFHWSPLGDGYLGCIGEQPCYLESKGTNTLAFCGADAKTVSHYLSLDVDLDEIIATFPEDDADLRAALDFAPGLRIIRQPAWECLASFMTSSMKKVSHIRQMSLALRESYAPPKTLGSHTLFPYPSPEAIAQAGETALRSHSLGYRAKGVAAAAERIASGDLCLSTLAEASDAELLKSLTSLYGVGDKIAQCVMLFGFDRPSGFPVDVWVDRIMRHYYFPRRRKALKPSDLQKFARKHFGSHAGYAQQVLFHHARVGGALADS